MRHAAAIPTRPAGGGGAMLALLHKTFDAEYEVEPLEELPPATALARFYFPNASASGGRDGVLVKVVPRAREASPWIGVFAFGVLSPRGLTGLFTCPNPKQLLVVARGAGYLVAVDDPVVHQIVKAAPVLGVYPVSARQLLVLSDYLHLVAYSSHGVAWETERLSWDGLEVEEVTEEQIRGQGWSSPDDRHVAFTVDLRDGLHQGGASPAP
jgi:hypothetical protein